MARVGADQEFNVFQAVGRRLVAFVAAQVGYELDRWHAQLGELLRDALIEVGSSLLACVRQLGGQGIEVASLFFQFRLQLLNAALAVVQRCQFGTQALVEFRESLRCDAVLAGHLVNGTQALFHFGQSGWVGVVIFHKVAQVVASLGDLNLGFIQHLDGFRQCRYLHRQLLQLL